MEIFIKIAQLIVSLSLLILVHEFGHYIFAKIFKCRVEKFYLFFDLGFTIWKKKIGDTEYGLGWLPLGGYCKISGMVDESMDKEQLAQPPKPWEFRTKPAWQRLIIIIGGVMMNFLIAIFIYIGMTFAWGERYIKTEDVTDGFTFSSVAQDIGFQNGDRIISVDGKTIDAYHDILLELVLSDRREVVVQREGQMQKITIVDEAVKNILNDPSFITLRIPFEIVAIAPGDYADRAGLKVGDIAIAADSTKMTYSDQYRSYFTNHAGDTVALTISRNEEHLVLPVRIDNKGSIGVNIGGDISKHYKISSTDYTFLQSIPKGLEKGSDQVSSYFRQLKLIASPKTEAYKSVGGFIAIGNIFPSQWNWYAFWNITALLSIMLAVINILPIPVLDGGHLMFILYEMVTRRKPSQKVMETAQMIGFFLIIGLIIYANGNDIIKLFT